MASHPISSSTTFLFTVLSLLSLSPTTFPTTISSKQHPYQRPINPSILSSPHAFSIEHPVNTTSTKPISSPSKPLHLTSALTYSPNSYRGWSSWSLQAYRGKGYGFDWLTEQHVKEQADVLFNQFSGLGYDRINLDSGWQDSQLDQYGRTTLNRKTFPGGIHDLQAFLAKRGLNLGLYFLPGIDQRAVQEQMPILNTDYTADEIIRCPGRTPQVNSTNCHRPLANAFGAGYPLNYSHPGSQMFVNSIVDQLYSWNVSFVKLDAIVPGSAFTPMSNKTCDTTEDLIAWRRAIEERYEEWQSAGRKKIWLVASWAIPVEQGALMDRTVNSWRVAQDIEAYGEQMTTFDRVVRNLKEAARWTSVDRNRHWRGLIDLDSVLVSDMSINESRTLVSLWAILGSPFYLGDDLVRLPNTRKALLQNPEVLALQALAATNPARLDRLNETQYEMSRSRASDEDCRAWAEKRRMVIRWAGKMELEEPEMTECGVTSGSKMSSDGDQDVKETREGLEWVHQVWVLEANQGIIFLAIVNAGRQIASDGPFEMDIRLSELETLKRGTDEIEDSRLYLMRDVWSHEEIGIRSFDEKFRVKLDVHETVLFKFSPL